MDPAVFAQAFSADAKSFVWGCNFSAASFASHTSDRREQ